MKLYQVQTTPRGKNVEAMFFCRLQVSKKFAKTASTGESALIDWFVCNLDHRTLTGGAEAISRVVARVRTEVEAVNAVEPDPGRRLVLTFVPMTQDHNGSICIERSCGRHQRILMPFTDYMGHSVFSVGRCLGYVSAASDKKRDRLS